MPINVQSIAFSKIESPDSVNDGEGWTLSEAEQWLKDHGYKHDTSRETEGQLRFRQFNPRRCGNRYENLTKNMPRGVQLVACKLKR